MILNQLARLAALAPLAAAFAPPDLLGPAYLKPTRLAGDTAVAAAQANVTARLAAIFATGKTPYGKLFGNDTALSVQVASLSDDKPLVEFHHSPDSLNVTAGSTTKVDSDTVYRIGSISKVFAVYALLLNEGRRYWDTSVAEFIPELKGQPTGSDIEDAHWDEVTVGALASQLGGVSGNYGAAEFGSLFGSATLPGLPKLPQDEIPQCGAGSGSKPCSRKEFLEHYVKAHPISLPYTKALYSNAGFHLLGYVIEAITKKSFGEAMRSSIVQPLGLKGTSAAMPNNTCNIVIPQGISEWNTEFGDDAPTGGVYSTANDLSTLGKAILSSKQLSGLETRRWLKPHSHTASWQMSVGAPWEIVRTRVDSDKGRPLDLYTKSGTTGMYSSLLVLVPDYDVVISILSAGADAPLLVNLGADAAAQTMLPVLDRLAREQTRQNLGGTYKPARAQSNTSITVSLDDKTPGLLVTEWISNGTDLIATLGMLAQSQGETLGSLSLYPTNLASRKGVEGNGTRHAFRAIIETEPTKSDAPRLSDPYAIAWLLADAFQYGGIGVDDFVFTLDGEGKGTKLEPRMMREVYEKE